VAAAQQQQRRRSGRRRREQQQQPAAAAALCLIYLISYITRWLPRPPQGAMRPAPHSLLSALLLVGAAGCWGLGLEAQEATPTRWALFQTVSRI
jgi:hypothetical protein